MNESDLIVPDWPIPATVHACATTRRGGVSQGAWQSMNLGAHVGDDSAAVSANRARLRQWLALPDEPAWLNQVHGNRVVEADFWPEPADADASISRRAGVACVVMTADCLPVLFCAADGSEVAAAHAGWRGLADGVLEATLADMHAPNSEIMAWLGPAIGPAAFEVGDEVRAAFIAVSPDMAAAFQASRPGHWLADIYALARIRLRNAGLTRLFGGGRCTYTEADNFFSYRRDGTTGRMASLIWIESP